MVLRVLPTPAATGMAAGAAQPQPGVPCPPPAGYDPLPPATLDVELDEIVIGGTVTISGN